MVENAPNNSFAKFGDFELALKSYELRRSGEPVKLQMQPARVLGCLVRHAGELVTRDELRQQVWPEGTFVDFEHGLNFCIKQIRAALGDNAQAPVYIETLPRRGYRFIASVELLNPKSGLSEQIQADNPLHHGVHLAAPGFNGGWGVNVPPPGYTAQPGARPVPNAPPNPDMHAGPNRDLRRYVILLIVMGAILAGVYYAIRLRNRASAAPPVAHRVMLAVLPFDDRAAPPGQDFFSDGLTEEMIAQLGALNPERLGVIARTSVIKYKSSGEDIRQIGGELGVDYVLAGAIQRDGDSMRITAELIQARDQTHLWADSYEVTSGDLLTVQNRIASRIASALTIALLPSGLPSGLSSGFSSGVPSGGRENSDGDRDPAAHEAYLRGRYLWNKGDRDDLEKSVQYFQQAVDHDPNYALAYAGMADAYRLLAMQGAVPASQALTRAKDAALKSTGLNDNLAEGLSALGSVMFWLEWKPAAAEGEFRRALELNPSYGWAHHDYAWLLAATGRFDQAIEEIQKARDLDPLSPLANSDVGWVYLLARRYDEAIVQINRTLDLEPNFRTARECLMMAYFYKGMSAEALKLGKQILTEAGVSARDLAQLNDGDPIRSLQTLWRLKLRLLESASGKPGASSYIIAQLHAYLGETYLGEKDKSEEDKTFEWLAKAFDSKESMMVFLNMDPAFDGVRIDPRFARLVQRIGMAPE